MQDTRREKIIGTWYAVGAFIVWGLIPLYFKTLTQVPSMQMLAHRIFWTFLFVSILISLKNRWPEMRKIFSPQKNKVMSLLSALAISTNWMVFIIAVNTNHIVETSMGYFINPLLNVLLGTVFLKERLKFWHIVSVFLALIGVSYMTFQYGKIPWIALSLALSFGFYGLLRKISHVDSLLGLSAETAILSPFALYYLVAQRIHGTGVFAAASLITHLLLIGSGVVTAIPLLCFVHAARRIPLSTVGFIQYLAPSLHLFLGVIVFKEPFTTSHILGFGFIWSALIIYSLSHTPFMQNPGQHRLKDAEENQISAKY